MTPRALLTAIGATAVAFAIAIGTTASSASNQDTDTAVTAATAPARHLTTVQPEVAYVSLLPNQECQIAV